MENRCFSCMNPIKSNICEHCGNNNNSNNGNPNFLKPGSIIKNRYYIGNVLDHNGEGITYIAYDNELSCKVRVREFFPDTLCHREKNSAKLTVNPGFEIQYKALMTDFVELSKQLNEVTNCSILKDIDILADNSTIYTIYEDVEGVTLNKYLRENAGELTWEETENLFLPLLYTIKVLNSKGIIHRGISPETIIVTDKHELKLKGICTSAVRAINSEITPELFLGYAAPEQYQKCTSYGEWTDVYSICAVLYKVLTGTMPPRADIRGVHDIETKPHDLNNNIPVAVSDAIYHGLCYDVSGRTLYIKDLIGNLYAEEQLADPNGGDGADFDAISGKAGHKFKLPIWLIVILITLPIMLIVFFLVYNIVLGGNGSDKDTSSIESNIISSDMVSSGDSSEKQPSGEVSSQPASVVVDNFVGKYYDDVISAEIYNKMLTFKPKIEEFDETAQVGEIIKQDIAENEVVKQGQEVQLTVSKGKKFVQLPSLTDANGIAISPEDYKKFLTDNGILVKMEKIDSPNTPSGQIDSLSHSLTVAVDRSTVKEITIYVAN